jgi:hypothetical protein
MLINDFITRPTPKQLSTVLEQRSWLGYGIELEVSYALIDKNRDVATARGKTINLTSSGMLCMSSSPIVNCSSIRVRVTWPVRRDGAPLELIAEGNILRWKYPYFSLQMKRYQFRPWTGNLWNYWQ